MSQKLTVKGVIIGNTAICSDTCSGTKFGILAKNSW